MDSPSWYYRYLEGNIGVKQLQNLILGFVGIRVVKSTLIGSVNKLSNSERVKWIEKIKSF